MILVPTTNRARLVTPVILAAAFVLVAGAGRLLGALATFDAASPPAGQENFGNLWNITLHNSASSSVSVSFRVEARDAKAGSVFSAGTNPVLVPSGDLKISARDVKLTEVWCRKGFEAFCGPGPALPEGDYTYIITIVPGLRQNAFFLRVRKPKPVGLLWPSSGAVVNDSQPVFVWTPPVASGPAVAYNYSLRVVELGRGQTAQAALTRNAPIFESGVGRAAVCRMPPRVKLVAGRAYAWRVSVTDTTGAPVDSARTQSPAGTFVYKAASPRPETHTSFTYPRAEHSVTGYASLVAVSDVPDADLCVLEYSLGDDSTSRDWQPIGTYQQAKGTFVGMWASDSAVIRSGRAFPCPCVVRATALGRAGQTGESAPLPLVINPPPPPDRRGCGCNNIPDE